MNEASLSEVSVHQLKELRDQDKSLCLIDVREQDEWNQLHIPGAIHIPKGNIAEQIKAITSDTQTPIYLHCRSGHRSIDAALTLLSLGYLNVYSVAGGIQEWVMFGYDVE